MELRCSWADSTFSRVAIVVIVLASCMVSCSGYVGDREGYILAAGMAYRGDFYPLEALSSTLVDAGWEVRLLLPADVTHLVTDTRLRIIPMEGNMSHMVDTEAASRFGAMGIVEKVFYMVEAMDRINAGILHPDLVQQLRADPPRLMITPFVAAYLDLADLLDTPLAVFFAQADYTPFMSLGVTDQPVYLVPYAPQFVGYAMEEEHMTLKDRLINTVLYAALSAATSLVEAQRNWQRGSVGLPAIPWGRPRYSPSYDSVCLYLHNGYWGWSLPVPLPPSVQYVGPLLRPAPAEDPLAGTDLGAWLAEQTPGSVTLVSLGTVSDVREGEYGALAGALDAAEMANVFVLRRHLQKSLNGELNLSSTSYGRLEEWVPQAALLRHPAVGQAVLHGGHSGIQESIRSRTPVLCIPFAFDQFRNCRRLHQKKLGIALDRSVLLSPESATAVPEALLTLRKNRSSFVAQLRRMEDFQARGDGPATLVRLVEETVAVGCAHRSSPFLNYSLPERLMVDVIFVLASPLIVLACTVVYVCRR